jgi:hypothetical protein
MPSSGAGAIRIQKKQEEKRRAELQNTQGIGFQLWNNRIGHHIM